MGKTNIEWCTHSLNFIKWWCTKTSEGCKRCYMMTLAKRYPQHAADRPVWRDKAYDELRRLPPGAEVFVGDMYDLFHEAMPDEFVRRHFQLIRQRPDCTFLLLTKRIERAASLIDPADFAGGNLWLGTSIENRKRLGRLDVLKAIDVPHRFISFEPLLEDLGSVDLRGVDGVIVGGESGAERRRFDPQWARNIRWLCQRDGARFFFKQGGAYAPGQERVLDGREWNDLAWRKSETVEAGEQRGLW